MTRIITQIGEKLKSVSPRLRRKVLEEPNRTIKTSDLYEATFYVLQGCQLINQECSHMGNQVSVFLELSGKNVIQLQAEYFSGNSQVNLFEFRRQYGYLVSIANQARKKYKNQLKYYQLPGQNGHNEGGRA